MKTGRPRTANHLVRNFIGRNAENYLRQNDSTLRDDALKLLANEKQRQDRNRNGGNARKRHAV